VIKLRLVIERNDNERAAVAIDEIRREIKRRK